MLGTSFLADPTIVKYKMNIYPMTRNCVVICLISLSCWPAGSQWADLHLYYHCCVSVILRGVGLCISAERTCAESMHGDRYGHGWLKGRRRRVCRKHSSPFGTGCTACRAVEGLGHQARELSFDFASNWAPPKVLERRVK